MIGETKSHQAKTSPTHSIKEILEEITGNLGKNARKKIELPNEIPLLGKLIAILESELWVLGGYSSSGKTFLALQMALKAANQHLKVGYLSLEMSREALGLRLWGALANVLPLRLEFGHLKPEELKKIKTAKQDLVNLKFYLYDNLYQISQIEEVVKTELFDFVVVDFLQNLLPEKGFSDEYATLSNGIVRLQKLAKETKSSILVCSQLSNVEAKEGVSSKIIGFKGSGAIAAAADIALWLEKQVDFNKSLNSNNYQLYIRKNRRGSLFKIPLELTFPDGFFKKGLK